MFGPYFGEWRVQCFLSQVAVCDLYDLRDHFFEHNEVEKAHLKNEQVLEKLKETLAILDYVQGIKWKGTEHPHGSWGYTRMVWTQA